MTSTDASARVMNALRRLVSALRTTGVSAPGSHSMSVAQQFALRVVGRHPGLTMSALASATLTTRSAVSEVVVRLVNAGLVRREPDASDHRRIRLHLTSDGLATFALLDETLPERLVSALNNLEPEIRDQLAAAMEAWIETSGLVDVTPTMFGEPSGTLDPEPNAVLVRTVSGTSPASER